MPQDLLHIVDNFVKECKIQRDGAGKARRMETAAPSGRVSTGLAGVEIIMSCFFFDLFDGETTIEDDVGVDLTDVSAARERAGILALRGIEPFDVQSNPFDPRELRVRSSAGAYVAKIAFRYVTP